MIENNLSDDAILAPNAVAQLTSLSLDTLRRLDERNELPKRIQLSPRRFGYRLGDIRAWLQSRAAG
jgi:predicted DNA-binding transcriptional regulator AlpA